MKYFRLNSFWLLFLFMATFFIVGLESSLDARPSHPKKRALNEYSLLIQANVKQAQVFIDGLYAGNAGTTIDIKPGLREIMVSYDKYVPRKFSMNVNSKLTQKVVKLLRPKASKDPDIPIIQFKDSVLDEFEFPKSCTIKNDTKLLPMGCENISFLDFFYDISISDYYTLSNVKTFRASQDLLSQAKKIEGGKEPDEETLESLYLLYPDNIDVLIFIQWNFIRLKKCSRVMEIAGELNEMGIKDRHLHIFTPICAELIGKQEIAQQFYRQLQSQKPILPDVYWHYARSFIGQNNQRAVSGFDACTKKYPSYLPCLVFGHALQSKKLERLDIESSLKRDKEFVKTLRKSLALAKKNRFKPLESFLSQKIINYKKSFELTWLLNFARMKNENINQALIPSNSLGLIPFSLQPALELHNLLEPSLEPALKVILYPPLIEAFPNKLVFPFNMAKNLLAIQRPQEALTLLSNYSIESRPNFMALKAKAFIAVKDYPQAETLLNSLVAINPEAWKSYFNLAALQERQGKYQEVVKNLSHALELNPPEGVQKDIQSKIDYYEKLMQQKPKGSGLINPKDLQEPANNTD